MCTYSATLPSPTLSSLPSLPLPSPPLPLSELMTQLSSPEVEGVYGTQVPLLFRAIVALGCVCSVSKEAIRELAGREPEAFQLHHLDYKTLAQYSYLPVGSFKYIYLYHSQK